MLPPLIEEHPQYLFFQYNKGLCNSMANEPQKIIYSMIGVSKFYNKKPVIKDISLSFFHGAKIGVLGLNGAGKSTVLRIMAGVDKDFEGEARPQPDIRIGFLEQEPL